MSHGLGSATRGRRSHLRDSQGIGALERLVLSEIDQLYPPARVQAQLDPGAFVDDFLESVDARADREEVLAELRLRLADDASVEDASVMDAEEFGPEAVATDGAATDAAAEESADLPSPPADEMPPEP